VILRAVAGDTIAVCPPLVISEGEIHDLFDCLERALDRGLDWVRKDGKA
jgi:4-aminobutyrate--pyruvate transaminase